MEVADQESHEIRSFDYVFKTLTIINDNFVTVELGPVKGKLGVRLEDESSPPNILKIHNWSELNKLNIDKCELKEGRLLAADIGEGGEGAFVDISKLTAGEFLRRKEQCGDRGVTLRIRVRMPLVATKFLQDQRFKAEQTERAKMEVADLESHRIRGFGYVFKTLVVLNEEYVRVELGPVEGKLGLLLEENVSPPTIVGVRDWSELNKLNIDKCELLGGKVVAADIGEGGEGDFVDVSMMAAEGFLRRKGQCGGRGVTLRINVFMPMHVTRFLKNDFEIESSMRSKTTRGGTA